MLFADAATKDAEVPTVTSASSKGAVADLASYGMGQLRADDRALHIGGPHAPEATAFKGYFPGP